MDLTVAHRNTTSRRTGRLASTNREIRAAAALSVRAQLRDLEARRGIEAIDEVLGAIEEYHLSRRPRQVGLLPAWRFQLEVEGGLALPPHILGLRHTARIHGALLDFQGVLLDEVMPERVAITEADEQREMHEQLMAVVGRAAA
jgi:hypothetical protein